MARPRSELTPKQAAFVNAKMLGHSNNAAAAEAGYSTPHAPAVSTTVQEQLAAARRWLTDTTQIRRLDVIEGIIDGIEMARHLGDPNAVIKGWVEVGKILGHTAPEVKVTHMTVNQMNIQSKFQSMSVEELLAISEGRPMPKVVNG